mmetsp:Transcript_27051/g.45067  ORF Transcript_27051/g.45067 Transcript_27051/m.45067 type:complete len:219 (-) Transcript_27051:458-1114(-)
MHHFLNSLNNSHNETSKANTTKAVRHGPDPTLAHSLAATRTRFVGCKPPRSDRTGHRHMCHILDDLHGPKVRNQKQKDDSAIGFSFAHTFSIASIRNKVSRDKGKTPPQRPSKREKERKVGKEGDPQIGSHRCDGRHHVGSRKGNAIPNDVGVIGRKGKTQQAHECEGNNARNECHQCHEARHDDIEPQCHLDESTGKGHHERECQGRNDESDGSRDS